MKQLKYLNIRDLIYMKNSIIFFAVLASLGIYLTACNDRKSTTITDKKKIDSLFLGISMGMERKEFYDYCWKMNSQQIFNHGPTSQSVEYRLLDELKSPVSMQFYPSFYNEKIYEMPVLFNYESWAPWNKEFSSDSLFIEILPLFKKWYGEDFQELQHPTMGKIYYQMKGRRRINIFIKDDQFVQAVFTNLKIEKEIKEEKERALMSQKEEEVR
jgi:hypothetical protein